MSRCEPACEFVIARLKRRPRLLLSNRAESRSSSRSLKQPSLRDRRRCFTMATLSSEVRGYHDQENLWGDAETRRRGDCCAEFVSCSITGKSRSRVGTLVGNSNLGILLVWFPKRRRYCKRNDGHLSGLSHEGQRFGRVGFGNLLQRRHETALRIPRRYARVLHFSGKLQRR